MALAGMHIMCGFVGNYGGGNTILPLFGQISWSETQATAGVTTHVAPSTNQGNGQPCFEFSAAADSFVAIGPNPNASAEPRLFVGAGTTRDIFCNPGDKAAWVTA